MSKEALCIRDLQAEAESKLSKSVLDYFKDGAEDGLAHRENAEAYNNYKIRPRHLRDVSNVDTTMSFLGSSISFPLAIAPSGMQRMAHPDGEKATARAAAKAGVHMSVSTYSTMSLEDVKQAGDEVKSTGAPGSAYMLQLYVFKNRKLTQQLIQRAEKAGYKALLLTCDTPVLGNRYNMARNDFKMPPHLGLPNFGDQKVEPLIQKVVQDEGIEKRNTSNESDPSITWHETLPWLRSLTKMEIWLKGIVTPEDVQLAINSPAKISGILVSNHGGRQLESAMATLDALPDCVAAARDPQTGEKKVQVWIDGGISKGSDIFKALALGADGVMIGRIPLWGLTVAGERGVTKALDILKAEFSHTMALAGCRTLADINKSYLARKAANGMYAKL